jgi:hypothetical protein
MRHSWRQPQRRLQRDKIDLRIAMAQDLGDSADIWAAGECRSGWIPLVGESMPARCRSRHTRQLIPLGPRTAIRDGRRRQF